MSETSTNAPLLLAEPIDHREGGSLVAKRENKRTTKANFKIDAALEKISHGKTGELRQEEEEKKSQED